MPRKRGLDSSGKVRKIAVEKAFDVLGKPTKPALLYHLKNHGIVLEDGNCSSLEEIEAALVVIFGNGASFVMNLIYSELERIQ